MASHINDFLSDTFSRLQSALESHKDQRLVIAVGNEAADLDSIISALSFSFLSHTLSPSSSQIFLPLINIPRDDLRLRPEVTFVLSEIGIDCSRLIFIDSFDISRTHEIIPVSFVLVDHNKLLPPFSKLPSPNILGILDHHFNENLYDPLFRTIEPVGSATTLVMYHFLADWRSRTSEEWNSSLARLFLAPILTDTVNLNPEHGRCTPKDKAAGEFLSQLAPDVDTNAYFKEIQYARMRISHLSNSDLLRKDYKEWAVLNDSIRVGIPAVNWHLRAWIAHISVEQLMTDLYEFAKARKLDVLIVMTAYDHPLGVEAGEKEAKKESGYERELIVLIIKEDMKRVKKDLENWKELKMKRLEGMQADKMVGFYQQENIKISRKTLWPNLKDLIEGKKV